MLKLALYLTAALALAQTPPAPEANPNSTMLSLNVVVTDKSGKPVTGLADRTSPFSTTSTRRRLARFTSRKRVVPRPTRRLRLCC